MTTTETVPVTNNTPVAPDPTTFTAAPLIEQLRQITTQVPGFQPADPKVWKTISRKSGYPNEYVESVANMVDASPAVLGGTSFDTAGARNNVKLSNELQALINEAQTLWDGLRFTNATLRASLVDACDQIYALAPGVERTDKSLTPHLEATRHASRRRGGKRKDAAPSSQAAAPPAVATAAPVVTSAPAAAQPKAG